MSKVLIMVLGLALILSSCGGGGGSHGGGGYYGGGSTSVSKVQSFINLLNNTNNTLFDSYVVKDPSDSRSEGFVVVWDEFIDDYVAYDIADYIAGDSWNTFLDNAQYQPVFIDYDEYQGFERVFIGDAYLNDGSAPDIFNFDGTFEFDETQEGFKDLEKIGALFEEQKVAKIGEFLSAEYGLSEGRGVQIAKLSADWEKLSKKRSMTDADAQAFSTELLGFDLNAAQNAIKKKMEGDEEEYNRLINIAAETNDITPEGMNGLISNIFAQQ